VYEALIYRIEAAADAAVTYRHTLAALNLLLHAYSCTPTIAHLLLHAYSYTPTAADPAATRRPKLAAVGHSDLVAPESKQNVAAGPEQTEQNCPEQTEPN
jgi:hypothetical protein